MKVAGLFAGIGGLECGMARAGHETTMLCEIDRLARDVLRERFPGAKLRDDVTKLARIPAGTQLVTAGFPCQDLSQAGRTAGIDGRNSGLVQVVLDLLERSLAAPKPVEWLVLENVPNMLRLARGAAMALIVRSLERLGYRWAYRVVDSRAFGLPQRRMRVYVVASRSGDPREILFSDEVLGSHVDAGFDRAAQAYGFYWTEGNRGLGWTRNAVPTLKGGSGVGIPSPPALWLVRRAPKRAFLVPTIEDAERLQGFEPGWTDLGGTAATKRLRWRLIGNAVSVPVAEWLGRRLAAPGSYDPGRDLLLAPDASWPAAAYGGPRQCRRGVAISSWPVSKPAPSISEFIGGEPLSTRAATGFLSRLRRSSLRRPWEFDEALSGYISANE